MPDYKNLIQSWETAVDVWTNVVPPTDIAKQIKSRLNAGWQVTGMLRNSSADTIIFYQKLCDVEV